MKHTFSFAIVILLFSLNTIAQPLKYTVPSEYSFSTPGEHESYQTSIIECVNWLEGTPLDSDFDKREKAVEFLNDWIDANPNVEVELNKGIIIFTEKNPVLLEAFKGGWARLVVKDSSRSTDRLGCNLAGLICAMNLYQTRGRKKDKEMEKLLKIMKKNELSKWVSQQLAL